MLELLISKKVRSNFFNFFFNEHAIKYYVL